MKKYVYMAAVLLAAVSCTKENRDSRNSVSGESRITVTATADATKTAISHSGSKYSFTWQAGDAISLLEYVAETQSSQKVTSDGVAASGNTASFTATLGALEKEASQKYHYVAAYPSDATFNLLGWQGSGADAYPLMQVSIPEEQELPSCSTFDPKADIMVSQVTEGNERPASLNASFARVGGILKIHLTGLPTEGSVVYIQNGEFSVYNPYSTQYCLAGDFIYYSADGGIAAYSGGSGGTGSGSGTGAGSQVIGFSGGTQCPVNTTDGSADVWLRCCAGTMTGIVSMSLTVMADGDERIYKKEAEISGGSGSGSGSGEGGTTGGGTTGGGTTGGGGTSGITISNGGITAISIALEEEEVPEDPEYVVSITKKEVSGTTGCVVTAQTTSKSGSFPASYSTRVYYSTSEPKGTVAEFVAAASTSSEVGTGTAAEFSAELKDLTAGTAYYICASFKDETGGTEYYSGFDSFETEKAPEAMGDLAISLNTSGNSFTASWQKVTGAAGYTCSYYPKGSPAEAVPMSWSADDEYIRSASASGLSDGDYVFSVTPVNGEGYLPCTTPYTQEFSIGGSSGSKITFTVKYDGSGVFTASGKVMDESFWGGDWYVYIGWVEGTATDPKTISPQVGAQIQSDGTYSYSPTDEDPKLSTGKTYSFSASYGTGEGNMQYSEVVVVETN